MYVYCVYPAISKSPKTLAKLSGNNESKVVLIVYNGVICDVRDYIRLPFLSVALHESGTRNALLGPWPNNAEIYLTLSKNSTQDHNYRINNK